MCSSFCAAGYREEGSEAKKPSFEGFNVQAATAAAYGYPAMPGMVPGLNAAGAAAATNFQVRLSGTSNLLGVSHPQMPLLPSVPAVPSILSMQSGEQIVISSIGCVGLPFSVNEGIVDLLCLE